MKLKFRKKDSTSKSSPIVGMISRMRLPEVVRPKFADKLFFPDDITELTAQNVSELLGKYTLLFSFVNQEAARINRELLELDGRSHVRRNTMLRERPGLNTIDKNKRDAIYHSDEVMEMIYIRKRKLEAERIFADMFLQNYEKYIVALSRELTRKGTDEAQNMKMIFRQR